MIYTLLSLGLLALGLTSLYRDHSHERGALAGGLSYLVGAITVMLWPTNHSAIFDAATHAPGLGRLVNDMCATLSVMLQFIFITSLSKAWYRWRRIAVVVYVALLVGFVELWFPIYGAPGHALARDLYAGYASGPLLVRVWNTIVGLTIPYTCVLAFIGFNQANGRIHNRYPRFTTAAGTTTYGLATVYGSLVVAQLGAAWLGRGDIGIKRFLGPIVVLCLVLILVDTGFVLFGPRILRRLQRGCAYIRQWFSLTEKQAQINRGIERLEQLLVDNTNAAGVASDQRVHLDKYADAAVIDAVDVHLKAHGIAAYERKAGRQAVRYLVLNRANAVRPLYDDERPVGEDEDDSGLAGLDDEGLLVDLSRREQEHLYVHADAARIAGLIILMQRGETLVSGRLTELEPRQEAEGWRREVAALIVEVLRAHARDKKPTLFVVERRKMTRTSFVADRRKVTRKTPKQWKADA